MYVGYGAFALHLPHVRDLKSKRRIIHGLIDRIHARHRVSVAETGAHDLHQRSELGIAVVASSAGEVEQILDHLRELVENETEAMVLAWEPRIVDGEH